MKEWKEPKISELDITATAHGNGHGNGHGCDLGPGMGPGNGNGFGHNKKPGVGDGGLDDIFNATDGLS